MPKFFSTSLLLFFLSAICLAEEASAPKTDNTTTSVLVSGEGVQPVQPSNTTVVTLQASAIVTGVSQEKPLTFTGIVDSISSSQIVLNNGKGELTPFAVARDVTVAGKDGKETTLIWINKGNKVTIEYITGEGSTKIVKHIKVLALW